MTLSNWHNGKQKAYKEEMDNINYVNFALKVMGIGYTTPNALVDPNT